MYKYAIIKNWIKERTQNSLESGKLPSVRKIASLFSVSVATVLRALTDLEHEKVLIRRQGTGLIPLHPDSIEATETIPDTSSIQKILFAYPEYVAEAIYKTSILVEQNLRNHHATSVNFRIKQTTTLDDILEFANKASIPFNGLIIHGSCGEITSSHLKKLSKFPYRIAFINNPSIHIQNLPENCRIFTPDPALGAEIGAEYFASHGHTRIGYLRNEPYCDYLKTQIEAFSQALHARGINFNRNHVFSKPIHFWEDSMVAAQAIINDNIDKLRKMRISALYVSSCNGACAIVEPLRLAGFNVPADISIIAEGDMSFAKYMSPPITTIASDIPEITENAVNFIFGTDFSPNHPQFFSLHLIERKSVASKS